jgi:hypothetical protein
VGLDVPQERDRDAVAHGTAGGERQDQQRQPGDGREDDDPARQELQRIAGQPRAPEQLVERPPEDEREFGGLFVV